MKLCLGFFCSFQSENTIRLSLTLYQCTRIFRLFPEAMDSGVRHATKRKTKDSIPWPCLALNALFRYISRGHGPLSWTLDFGQKSKLNPKHQTPISNAIQEVIEIFGHHILKSLRMSQILLVSSVKPIGLEPAYQPGLLSTKNDQIMNI